MSVLPHSISLNKAWYALIFIASIFPALIIAPWLTDKAQELLFERALLQEEVYHKQIEAHLSLETERLISVLVNKSDPIALDITHNKPFSLERNKITNNLLQRLMSRETIFNTITIYDNHAKIITSTSRNQHSSVPITTESPAFVITQRNRTFVGSPIQLHDNHFEFFIAVPLFADGHVIGTVITTINILEFWRKIQSKVITPEENMVYLIDGRGVLLAHEQSSHLRQGDLLTNKAMVRALLTYKNWNNTHTYQGFEQQDVFGIGSHINNLSWSIISEIPSSRIMIPIEKALAYLIFIVFLVHIVFGFFGIFMVRKMLRPIQDLTQAMRYAEDGNYQIKLPNSSYAEIQNLIQHFQSMANTIAKRESELGQFLLAIEHLGESILITNQEGIIHYINPAFKETTAYDDSILGTSMLSFPQSDKNNTACHYMKLCIQTGKPWEGKTIAFKANGESFPALMHISPVFSNNHITHFIAILQDMSEHDLLEAQLFQAQKMESIGTLVGGIAHDFNNNLAAIMGNTYLAQTSIKAGKTHDTLQKIKNIEALSQHATKVVAQLMAYARQDIVQKENLSFNSIIEDTLSLSSVAIPKNIQFTTHIEKNECIVFADKSQIQQALMNLLNNARDTVAEAKQPRIELNIKPVVADTNFRKRNPDVSTSHLVHLSIKDNGHGIAEKDLPHIFDPFFTTKDVGKGTGLGLSMIFGMVQSHHGVIEVESIQGHGATFHIYLPVVKGELSIKKNTDILQRNHSQGESILLIDDDHDVRETTAEVLESFGYHVIQATDGLHGLQCFTKHENIAVIIVDLIMPQMGGIVFAQELRKHNADINIIFLTGYDKPSTLHEHNINQEFVLTKPIDFDVLHHAILQSIKDTQPA